MKNLRAMPEVDRRQDEIDEAIANILALRRRNGRVTVEDSPSARQEGRIKAPDEGF